MSRVRSSLRLLGRLVLILLAAALVGENGRIFGALVADEGAARAARNSIAWHKLGELLVLLPWLLHLLRSPRSLPRPALALMLLGAAAQVPAWLDLSGRADWAPWCAALPLFVPLAWLSAARGRLRVLLTALVTLGWFVGATASVLQSGYVWYPFPGAPPVKAGTREEVWRQDLDYLVTELTRLHVDAFHTTPRAELEAEARAIAAAASECTDLEVIARVACLVARIGDAHTTLAGPSVGLSNRLPIVVRWFADGLGLTHVPDDLPQRLALVGARITHIAGVPADEVFERVRMSIPNENRSWLLSRSPEPLVRPQWLEALGALPEGSGTGPVELTLEYAPEHAHLAPTLTLEPLKQGETPSFFTRDPEPGLAERHPASLFWFERLDESDAVYVRYRRCRDFFGFRRFAKSLGAELEADPPAKLVVDLRGNTGGSSLQYSWFLMPLLAGGPFDDPERLFLLFDRGTFSSGSGAAIESARGTRATLVGEPTGGALNVYGEVRTFQLPGSRLTISYSTKFHRRFPDSKELSLAPDVEIVPTRADWVAGRDPALDFVLD